MSVKAIALPTAPQPLPTHSIVLSSLFNACINKVAHCGFQSKLCLVFDPHPNLGILGGHVLVEWVTLPVGSVY